jgi:hypothetical protein
MNTIKTGRRGCLLPFGEGPDGLREGARLLRQAHSDIVIKTRGTLGWVVRKDAPKLSATINEFLKTHRQRTALASS